VAQRVIRNVPVSDVCPSIMSSNSPRHRTQNKRFEIDNIPSVTMNNGRELKINELIHSDILFFTNLPQKVEKDREQVIPRSGWVLQLQSHI
jgi:hypothetical protein